MGRFQREAEVLASLNHPNIAGIYDLLFYGTSGLQLMVVPYRASGGQFVAEKPHLWSSTHFSTGQFQRYDLHPDGERFAVSTFSEPQTDTKGKVVFIFNFFDELRRIAPVSKR